MGNRTLNFVRKNNDGSFSSDFKLRAYEAPESMSISVWSASGRSIFQREYTEMAKELTAKRKISSSQAVSMALQRLNLAVSAASTSSKPDWRTVYCAVPMNNLVWLALFDKDEDAASRMCNELAVLLKNKVCEAYDKVRCPAMTSWPITDTGYNVITSKTEQPVKGSMISCLLTAYAASMAEKAMLTPREDSTHGLSLVDRQDRARATMSSIMGIIYPRWLAIRGIFATGIGEAGGTIVRTPVMPIVTGLARTLIMVTMPVEEAAIITTDILASSWPISGKRLSKELSSKYTAQLFAGMACTVGGTPEEAINKTCYVWTRYLW